ncbi:FKBP-type peptidyl-prolyl cis-trans isomerase [Pedobacter glucosidilyticus]|uniref:FKBP-type peptidyl-prolyl cis-trans isomerase n=1 Tax=Pedobacter glucosidilyticus TaxID=1122941 RepID=UPI000425517C|nr:FKBP-type peptidyl-prolyl cis-trans isomerase [Pedobacter glucosidilyticus]
MKKGLLILSIAALGFAACNGGFKKGASGLLYKVHEDVEGDSIKEGDFISLNIIAKTDGDSVLYNSYEMDRASQTFVPKPMYDGDLFTAIMQLTKGDSATIKVDIDSAEKKGQPRPQGIKGKYIIYTVKIEDVIKKDTTKEQEFQSKIEAFFKAEGDRAKKAEAPKLEKYIKDNSLKAQKYPSGLQVATLTEGTGVQPKPGDSVMVNYTGKLVSGKVFDTSLPEVAKKNNIYNPAREPYTTLNLVIGQGNVIPGFDEGVLKMKKGGKSVLLIPSALAYGEQGMQGGMIGPFTPLVFEIELVNVVPGKGVATPISPEAPKK